MEPVIAWALAIASGIFGLGMISAIASRRQREKNRAAHLWEREKTKHKEIDSTERQHDGTGGMSMAAGGTGNLRVREDELASISGNSR